MNIKFNIKSMGYGIALIVFVLIGFIVLPNMFKEDIECVDYVVVQRDSIPDKILDMMDDYIDQERVLSIMIDKKVYVIVTRGDNTDYGLDIEKITLEEKNKKQIMTVDIVYKEKSQSYPFVVVETNMQSLPEKIQLNKKFAAKNKAQ